MQRFLAGVLGQMIVARHARVRCEPIVVTIDRSGSSPKLANPDFIDWVELARQADPDEYLRTRMLVLCARAWAETFVIQRSVRAQKKKPTGDEFWQCLAEHGDDSIANELAMVHLTRNREAGSWDADRRGAFEHRINQTISALGLKPVSAHLTEAEFLCFLDAFCQARLTADGGLANGSLRFDDGVVADYQPGTEEMEFEDVQSKLADRDDGELASGRDVLGGQGDDDVRCLFAHELGHWIAAHKLGIRTSLVDLTWSCRWNGKTNATGHCTTHFDHVAARWDDLRYIEARIGMLAAGALADYSFRYPGRQGIGNDLYAMLKNGTGSDDFLKMRELLIMYLAVKARDDENLMQQFRWPLSMSIVLEGVTSVMRRLGLWELLQSDRFRAFVTEIIDAGRSKVAGEFSEDSQVRIRMRTACVKKLLDRHPELREMAWPSC